MNKVIAITGASSGIGLATALTFAQNGWTVYAGTRHKARDSAQYADRQGVHFLEMEVTSSESLQQAFAVIEHEAGHLDVLFCNAGYGFFRSLGQADMQDVEAVFNTNVYGVMHSIRAGLNLLRKSRSGHIIATSSVGGLVGQPMNEIYCASKFAVEGLLESLAVYYKPLFNIDVTILEPGAIATSFFQTVQEHVGKTGGVLDDEYKSILTAYMAAFSKRAQTPQSAESVAEVVLNLVQSESKPLRLRTSEAAELFVQHKIMSDPTGMNGILRARKMLLDM